MRLCSDGIGLHSVLHDAYIHIYMYLLVTVLVLLVLVNFVTTGYHICTCAREQRKNGNSVFVVAKRPFFFSKF